MGKMIYLDNAATTKTAPEVVQAMLPYFSEYYGNPSSIYDFAGKSKEAITKGREQIAEVLGAKKEEIYFTAGGSESDNWALKATFEAYKAKGNHIITTKIEHHAILHTCEYLEKRGAKITYVDVDENGIVKLDERVKVIPYAALLIEKTARDGKADTYLKLITETALENLREEGKLLYMPEILEQYAQILEKENSNAEFIGLLRQERASLLELESDYKVSFKNYRLFDHVVRNFEIDAELIRRTRNAAKLTQEGLSEDICAQETLARIENGNQKPRSGNLRQMMEKMGRSGDRIETGIQVEEYETLELKIEFSKFIHRKEYGNAEKVLSKIEEKLDCNLMKNYQYIETERVKVKYKENAEYTEQFIKQLKELLAMSLKVEEGQKIEYVLNTEEVSILTEMALIYWGEQNYKVALEIYQFLVGQYEKSFIKPVFHILDWGMSMGNYGMALEELGYFEKAIGVCRKRIQQTLFAGKGGSLHTSLMVEACILEAQKDVKCKKYFKQDLDLLRLYKMQTNYKLMESYVKTNKIFD